MCCDCVSQSVCCDCVSQHVFAVTVCHNVFVVTVSQCVCCDCVSQCVFAVTACHNMCLQGSLFAVTVSLKGQERAIVSQMNIETISKVTLGKLLRDGVERIWAFPST